MRRLVLISALLLASASAYAGESRDLVLASSDAPATTEIPRPLPPIKKSSDTRKRNTAEPAKSLDAKPLATKPLAAKPLAAKSLAAKSLDAKSLDAKSVDAKSLASRSAFSADRYGAREAKARRIAARYGIRW
jgi:hypothetical protein